jgi:hypothetical protein
MATNMTGMRVEGTTVVGTGAKRSQGRVPRIGAVGVIAATLALLLVGSVVLHDRATSHAAVSAIPRAVTSQQARFLENNTTNLPNAVTADPRPIVTSARQKFLDVNTTWLPGVNSAAAPSVMSSSQRRLLEVNTVMLPEGPSSPYAEDLTPLPGHRR